MARTATPVSMCPYCGSQRLVAATRRSSSLAGMILGREKVKKGWLRCVECGKESKAPKKGGIGVGIGF
jgi:DNA-directed RNA polymerase subunit RPC12/RpoP